MDQKNSDLAFVGKNRLNGKRVAILAADGFEQSELFDPREVLEKNGAVVSIVSLGEGRIRGWNQSEWGRSAHVDYVLGEVSFGEFDALVLPGGVMSPDKLRADPRAVEFVQTFIVEGKPIAAICHGPWTLIETGMLSGRSMTSWSSLKTDLINAGATWVDHPVVVDRGLVTSRSPEDLVPFCEKMVEEFAREKHAIHRNPGLTRDDSIERFGVNPKPAVPSLKMGSRPAPDVH